ncbi:hypothetical protein IT398_02840 [Candidatus Nomurabacteria bacterium]|nr:hypothetical protein [Candidatus Nomurabacteria bacterium]
MIFVPKPGPQTIGEIVNADFAKTIISWPDIVRRRREALMRRGIKRVDLTKPRR